MALKVGISYGPARGTYPNYHRAVGEAGARIGVDVETVDLSESPQAVGSIDALLLTGGPDVDPARYGMAEYIPLCSLDTARDDAEFEVLEAAMVRRVPLFAICRGAQLLSVARGGTLIPDLPDVKAVHHGQIGGRDRRHPLSAREGSLLARLAGTTTGEVNSSHHQAIDRLPAEFAAVAYADDATLEAFEWADPEGKPYLLAVQWHPERMDAREPFAGRLFERFVSEADVHHRIGV